MVFKHSTMKLRFAICFAAAGLWLFPQARAQDAQPQAAAAPPAAAPAAAPIANAASAEQKIGPWRALSSVDGNGRELTELRLAASKPYTDEKSKQYIPDFVLICERGGKTTAYIDMQHPIGSPDDETVQLQYGSTGAYPVRTEWNLSKDRMKVISTDPLNFVTEIRERTSLDFQLTPYEKQPISVFFNLDSIDKAFELMSERCFQ